MLKLTGKPGSPPTDTTDEALLQRYLKGELSAFRQLVERHEAPLWRYCLRKTRDEAVAEELVQEIFIRLVRHAKKMDEGQGVAPWLYTVARNLCIDHARRMTHRKTWSLDRPRSNQEGDGAAWVDFVPDSGLSSEQRFANKAFVEALSRALGALPEAQREVFLLREEAGLKFREIAALLEISENTVKSRMRYALEALRVALASFHEGGAG